MNNFTFHVPTDIRFGKGQVEVLPAELEKYGKKILLVYGNITLPVFIYVLI